MITRINFRNKEYIKIVRSLSGGYYVMGSVIRGVERADNLNELRDILNILAKENGGIVSNQVEKNHKKLKESTDRIKVDNIYYSYDEGNFNVVTGIIFDIDNGGGRILVGNERIGGLVNYFVKVIRAGNDGERVAKEIEDSIHRPDGGGGRYLFGHSSFEGIINLKSNYYDYYENDHKKNLRFRIYRVDKQYYFSMWDGYVENYLSRRDEIHKIFEIIGLDKMMVKFEVINSGKYKNYNNSSFYIFLSYDELFNRQNTEAKKIKNEIEVRLDNVNERLVNLERDFHAKKAALSVGERNRYLLELKNLRSESEALTAALAAGEVDLQRVVIKVFDKLEGDDESISSDILYRELEKNFRGYGTSAVQILQRIRDLKINPKDLMRSYK